MHGSRGDFAAEEEEEDEEEDADEDENEDKQADRGVGRRRSRATWELTDMILERNHAPVTKSASRGT